MESNNKIENISKLKIKQNSYSCNKCNKTPKIIFIDYKKNTIGIYCDIHKENTLKINDYLKNISKNDKCQNCYKNNNDELKYCINCNIKLCHKCEIEHIKKFNDHILIRNDEYNIKCQKHEKEFYIGYCSTCKEKICEECKKSRNHKFHNKFDYLEIQPTLEDFNIIKNFNLKIESEINKQLKEYNQNSISINNEKIKEIKIISEKYNKIIEEANIKWENTIKNYEDKFNKKKEKEILDNNNLKNEEINKINIKYTEIEKNNENYENIQNFKNIIILNNIIVNSYQKQKEYNLYYNENINKLIESINIYNENSDRQSLQEFEKYKIILNRDKTILNIKDDKIDNKIINKYFTNNFRQIKEMNVSSSLLNSIEFLTKYKFEKLEKLTLAGCPINNISILSNSYFTSLMELKITKSNLSNINGLLGENFKKLKVLNLSKNKIKDINDLKVAKFNENLSELYLNNNEICDISLFDDNIFSNLKILFLSYNKIEDISSLHFILINSCEILSLDNNKIKNISIFKNVENFFELKKLTLSNNPFDLKTEENKNIFNLLTTKNISLC